MTWYRKEPGPIFCLLLGVSSDYAQPITSQVTEVTCPVIGRAQPELTPSKRLKRALAISDHGRFPRIIQFQLQKAKDELLAMLQIATFTGAINSFRYSCQYSAIEIKKLTHVTVLDHCTIACTLYSPERSNRDVIHKFTVDLVCTVFNDISSGSSRVLFQNTGRASMYKYMTAVNLIVIMGIPSLA